MGSNPAPTFNYVRKESCPESHKLDDPCATHGLTTIVPDQLVANFRSHKAVPTVRFRLGRPDNAALAQRIERNFAKVEDGGLIPSSRSNNTPVVQRQDTRL